MTVRILFMWILAASLAGACAAQPPSAPSPQETSTPPPAAPTQPQNSAFQSSGGGEPRSIGYWLLWNSCAEGNQSETAEANGGREAGWIILDDLLQVPGILLGNLEVASCAQGVALLQQQAISGEDRTTDPAFVLASQLLVAQLNLAAGAESCPAAEALVEGGQVLLLAVDFQGTGPYLASLVSSPSRDTAAEIATKLAQYNAGTLCVP